jgi:hypothetical protein
MPMVWAILGSAEDISKVIRTLRGTDTWSTCTQSVKCDLLSSGLATAARSAGLRKTGVDAAARVQWASAEAENKMAEHGPKGMFKNDCGEWNKQMGEHDLKGKLGDGSCESNNESGKHDLLGEHGDQLCMNLGEHDLKGELGNQMGTKGMLGKDGVEGDKLTGKVDLKGELGEDCGELNKETGKNDLFVEYGDQLSTELGERDLKGKHGNQGSTKGMLDKDFSEKNEQTGKHDLKGELNHKTGENDLKGDLGEHDLKGKHGNQWSMKDMLGKDCSDRKLQAGKHDLKGELNDKTSENDLKGDLGKGENDLVQALSKVFMGTDWAQAFWKVGEKEEEEVVEKDGTSTKEVRMGGHDVEKRLKALEAQDSLLVHNRQLQNCILKVQDMEQEWIAMIDELSERGLLKVR